MKPGDVIDGRFEIGRVVANGGMGVIYRGTDLASGSLVAIKTVRSGGHLDRRFEREVETLAALRHPAIVSHLGHGRHDEELYLAMEWLEGEDLAARLAGADLTVDETLLIATQIAGALGAAHARGIVHRDVKPSNIFLVDWRPDNVKLLDFGIARRADLDTLTASGMLVGTPVYMAPEQVRGERDLDARVDVYALGALMYRCLAGRPPFDGCAPEELLARILMDTAPRLATFVEVPPQLDALIARMLARDPGDRPDDGRAVHAALVGMATAAPGSARDEAEPPPDSTRAIRGPLSSIAVLAFLDLSAGRDQGYLCEGVAEELTNALGHVDGLRVAARSASFQFKLSGLDARAIGARLGVQAVLEGGVRKSGQRLRVTVQLIDVADGYQRWSHRFDGSLEDVFAIEDEIARGVTTALRGILNPREKDAFRRPETKAAAYEYFLRGRQLLQAGTQPGGAARQMFERAIEIDPAYAPAYAGLAQMHGWSFEWFGGGAAALAAADRASLKALELAPQLSESHVARGVVLALRREYTEAGREYEEAIRLHPASFEAHYLYGRACFSTGDIEASTRHFRRGAEIRADDYQSMILLAQSLTMLGRAEAARIALQDGLRRAERQLELEPNDARALALGACALEETGQVARALEWSARALEISPDDPGILINASCVFARLGRKEDALGCLERTFGRGFGKRDWVEHDPDYDSLRDDPRFQAMLAKLT